MPRTTNITTDAITKEVRRRTIKLFVFTQPSPTIHDTILQNNYWANLFLKFSIEDCSFTPFYNKKNTRQYDHVNKFQNTF